MTCLSLPPTINKVGAWTCRNAAPGQVGASSAGNHRSHPLRPLRGRQEGRPGPGAGPEQSDRQFRFAGATSNQWRGPAVPPEARHQNEDASSADQSLLRPPSAGRRATFPNSLPAMPRPRIDFAGCGGCSRCRAQTAQSLAPPPARPARLPGTLSRPAPVTGCRGLFDIFHNSSRNSCLLRPDQPEFRSLYAATPAPPRRLFVKNLRTIAPRLETPPASARTRSHPLPARIPGSFLRRDGRRHNDPRRMMFPDRNHRRPHGRPCCQTIVN